MSTLVAQPAIFTVEYALAQLWLSWGLKPRTMIGHSIGEFVVACLAGVFSLEDALKIVAARGRLMQDLPGGAMLAVRLTPDEIEPILPPALAIAAINGPTLSVVAGPHDAIAAFQAVLTERGAFSRLLATSHAFHSPMMDPMVDGLRKTVAGVNLSAPRFPYISTVTGGWINADEAMSPDYWARHAREPVRFHAALKTLFENGNPALVEVGPGTTLTNLARQAIRGLDRRAISSLPDPSRETDDLTAILMAIGDLWTAGIGIDFAAVRRGRGRRISLPTYPFQRTSHWVAPPSRLASYDRASIPLAQAIVPAPSEEPAPMLDTSVQPSTAASGNAELHALIKTVIEELSGESMAGAELGTSFLEMGFDSLFLGQVAQRLQNQTKVKISFRQLLRDQSTIEKLASFLAVQMPAPAPKPVVTVQPAAAPMAVATRSTAQPAASGGIEDLFRAQMDAMKGLFDQQLQTLQQMGGQVPQASATVPAPQPAPAAATEAPPADETPSRFQVYRAGAKSAAPDITDAQRAQLESIVQRYAQKSAGSKRLTARYRPSLADPRAAAGFRARMEGDGLSDRRRTLAGLEDLGRRRQRVHRPGERLRPDRVRPLRRTSSPRPSPSRSNDGFADRAADSAGRRGRRAVPRDDRQRARDLLQHRLRSGDGGHARGPHRHRTRARSSSSTATITASSTRCW